MLAVFWAASTTTAVEFSFKLRDSRVFTLSDQVTGGTNADFAAGAAFSGLVYLPPSPIEHGATSAAVVFA